MKTLKVIIALCIFAGFTLNGANAQSTSAKIVNLPFGVFIDCAGEDGEVAFGEINLHIVMHYDKEGLITKTHFQPMSGTLIGDVTGNVYHPTGVTQQQMAGQLTYINIFHIVGPGVQAKVKALYHLTINANGDVTAEVDNFDAVCK